jgi:hypothetical protein
MRKTSFDTSSDGIRQIIDITIKPKIAKGNWPLLIEATRTSRKAAAQGLDGVRPADWERFFAMGLPTYHRIAM